MSKIISMIAVALFLAGCASNDTTGHHHTATIDESDFSQASPAPDGGTFLSANISEAVKSLELFDTEGKPFSLSDLQGQIIVLANFYTSCSHVCPMTSANMKEIANDISASGLADKITVLEVSVDGNRDDVQRIRAYQELFGEKSWMMATGSQSNLEKFWKSFGVIPESEPLSQAEQESEPKDWLTGETNKYRMIDAPVVVLIDPNLKWRWLNTGFPDASEEYVPSTLMNYLSEHGLDTLENPGEGAWTLKSVFSAIKQISGYEIG